MRIISLLFLVIFLVACNPQKPKTCTSGFEWNLATKKCELSSDDFFFESIKNEDEYHILDYPLVGESFSRKYPALGDYLEARIKTYVDEFMAQVEDWKQESLSDTEVEFGMPWNMGLEIVELEEQSEVFSLMLQVYQYTGGAHGNVFYEGINYDVLQNKIITLDEIFVSDEYLVSLTDFVKSDIIRQKTERYPETDFSDDFFVTEGATPEPENYVDFLFKADGLEFYFAPYHMGPYAEGSFQVLVPWSVLNPFLAAQYQGEEAILNPVNFEVFRLPAPSGDVVVLNDFIQSPSIQPKRVLEGKVPSSWVQNDQVSVALLDLKGKELWQGYGKVVPNQEFSGSMMSFKVVFDFNSLSLEEGVLRIVSQNDKNLFVDLLVSF